MKTSKITMGLAILASFSCHRIPVLKSSACCAKDGATSAIAADANNSIYQLGGSWIDQHGKQLTLSKLQGRPQIVAMIFTHCVAICPRVVSEMKAIRDSLPASVRNQVGGLLVSFDPDRDTPAQLSTYAEQHQLDNNWELLKGGADQVRELSMVLDVKYEKLSGGSFSHTGSIYILDQRGNIVQAVSGLGGNIKDADAALTRLVRRSGTEAMARVNAR